MIETLFNEARSAKTFTSKRVPKDDLKRLYELVKWAPTESNTCPIRLSFITTSAAFFKLRPHIYDGNVPKIDSAPVAIIVAYDTDYHLKLKKLAPHLRSPTYFDELRPAHREFHGWRSAHLQAGMLITAIRAMGWDAGPLGGIDRPGIDQTFFRDTSWKTSFIILMGEADQTQCYPRGRRLEFDEACQIL